MSEESGETVGERLQRYERLARLTNWVGGGLLGIVALLAAGLVPPELTITKVTVSLVIVGGLAVGHVRQGVDWAATKLRRSLAGSSGLSESSSLPAEFSPLPKAATVEWKIALTLVVLAGGAFLVALWWIEIGKLIECLRGGG